MGLPIKLSVLPFPVKLSQIDIIRLTAKLYNVNFFGCANTMSVDAVLLAVHHWEYRRTSATIGKIVFISLSPTASASFLNAKK